MTSRSSGAIGTERLTVVRGANSRTGAKHSRQMSRDVARGEEVVSSSSPGLGFGFWVPVGGIPSRSGPEATGLG